MTQILNVPMPADEAIKIIRAIFESNRMTEVKADFVYEFRDFRGKAYKVKQKGIINDINRYKIISDVTILSVTPVIPTYSVGDEVMILATGEIGAVHELFKWNNKSGVMGVTVNLGGYTNDCFLNEICKIA